MSDIALTRNDNHRRRQAAEVEDWRRGLGFGSLRARIFAVNIFAVIVLALLLLYIDTVRARLIEDRSTELAIQAITIAGFVGDLPAASRAGIIERRDFPRGTRLRLYADDGGVIADNWRRAKHRFKLDGPETQTWRRRSARFIDRALEDVSSFKPIPVYVEAARDTAAQWEETRAAGLMQSPQTRLRRADDGNFVISAAAPVVGGGVIHLTDSAADLTRLLRAERLTSFWLLLAVTGLTLLLSSYLARTIVRPLRMLAIAAHRVRLGRSREVIVPRLPDRRDEIGALARAVSDMSIALRDRIDATEAFAADVAHELKNPLASLRSAVDTLDAVEQPDLRARLLAVIRDDVGRLDRLITDISDASRLDAELSRTRFGRVDAGALAAGLVAAYRVAGLPAGLSIEYLPPSAGAAKVQGDPARLAQVLRNLIDNAISFSPNPGLVVVSAETAPGRVRLRVEDEGPGVPPENRADVFKRFYSQRPDGEDYGRHSGLGLSIAGAIVEAHGGSIRVDDRLPHGACFTVDLPAD
ncbi:histidine kinase [Polymorphobacter glacialis]|uniref:histidine kinase n=1 Tax=Sandarakinorhabdus glacialis TaxID=1614636 RepID=A0A916ZX39_9SPHN|nr:HAMP domain-containing sensor histidine kinase [Polymorphobacter glacialis]GGE15666.1 histidine kinase [Polymorphobacter glacialis]